MSGDIEEAADTIAEVVERAIGKLAQAIELSAINIADAIVRNGETWRAMVEYSGPAEEPAEEPNIRDHLVDGAFYWVRVEGDEGDEWNIAKYEERVIPFAGIIAPVWHVTDFEEAHTSDEILEVGAMILRIYGSD
jgi:hypothetical protein